MHRDHSVKRGQLAHLDQDPSNNKLDNLAFLCFDHHDEYDSRSRQSKRLTITEVKIYRGELEEAIAAALEVRLSLAPESEPIAGWEGTYRTEEASHASFAELEIHRLGPSAYRIRGIAFWGIDRPYGPNTGELDAEATEADSFLSIQQGAYSLVLRRDSRGLLAAEQPAPGMFGLNVSFHGQYAKVPDGADVLPQPSRPSFESDFWPEEGRPVFAARTPPLLLHSRPRFDAPQIAQVTVEVGQVVDYVRFRYRTVRPGVLLAKAFLHLRGRNLGATEYVAKADYYHHGGELVDLYLTPGDRIEYLQYRAEGTAFIRWQGLVIDTDFISVGENPDIVDVTLPVTESWVQVLTPTLTDGGWVNVDQHLTEINRIF
jgi:hypothetical protein